MDVWIFGIIPRTMIIPLYSFEVYTLLLFMGFPKLFFNTQFSVVLILLLGYLSEWKDGR